MKSGSSARSIADLAGGVILAEVEVPVPPERVFEALTRGDEIRRWWGSPDAYWTESWTGDLRAGGSWHTAGRDAGGGTYTVEGIFLEVDPPHRLIQTWKADYDGGAETKVIYQLAATEAGTRLTLRHEGFAGRPESCQMHASGWDAIMGWLSQHLTPQAAPPANGADRFFHVRLLPPRQSFIQDMTPEEASVMQEHAAYWTDHLSRGTAIVFGPVADPKGDWGLGVVRVSDEEQMRAFEQGDPAIRSGRGFRYEVLPMVAAVTAS